MRGDEQAVRLNNSRNAGFVGRASCRTPPCSSGLTTTSAAFPPRVRLLADSIREHWGVENGLHWILDVQMGEDACPIRDTNGASNFALLRRMALTLLQRDETVKRGTKAKQKIAGWDDDYLLHLLTRGLA